MQLPSGEEAHRGRLPARPRAPRPLQLLLRGTSYSPRSAPHPACSVALDRPCPQGRVSFRTTASGLPVTRKLLPPIGVPVTEAPCFQDQHMAVASAIQGEQGSLGQEGSPVLGCGDHGQPSGSAAEGNGG